ncbi:MAG: hypothetical protein CME94_09040 [Hyphomonadaceae bacterium]|jgi:hypothetical protein|uniref:hypothetical protein n=1 Tax=Henriciella sp. TaxID=1968823 RepID=UPI000C0FA872|nr:hypothetical protein [Henriciella sp.]MBF34347.1 hypothetical protein [Hyphomonadaceae bacterium]PHR75253.1 MAG: hypothetical protein COA64_12435 [Henriciella sp.]|tara:strand:- start:1744 stop:2571 length:828 start_codon:yes stop_codon:yes gene_type:complete
MKLNRLSRGILLASAILAGSYMPADADTIRLDPTSLEIGIAAGERQRDLLTLTNETAETLDLTLGLADWALSSDGELTLIAPGDTETSAAGWVRVSPGFVTLAPGEQRDILIDIIAPSDFEKTGARRTALLASSIAPDTRAGHNNTLRKLEVASLVYLTGPGAYSQPAIRDVTLSKERGTARRIDLMIENTGSAHARLQGSIEIDGKGRAVTIPLASLVVLGKSSRTFSMPVREVLPADARVSVTLIDMAAPQSPEGRSALPRYTAPLTNQASFR